MRTWADSGLGGVAVVGINSRYLNSAVLNTQMVGGSLIPWLQDTQAAKVWEAAWASKDDIYVLDGQFRIVRYFSALDRPLSLSDGHGLDTLRAWVRQLAGP